MTLSSNRGISVFRVRKVVGIFNPFISWILEDSIIYLGIIYSL